MLPGLVPADARFIGDPVDLLIIEGMSAAGDEKNTKAELWINIVDIKTGSANLSTTQRQIRNAVTAGRVKFTLFNPETQEIREWKAQLNTTQVKSD